MADPESHDRRTITAGRFAALLARLDPDRDRAAAEYERLRRTLVKFFDWRGHPAPDECADDTLDRLARKLTETTVDDVFRYAYGIARLVLLEQQRLPGFDSMGPGFEYGSAPPAAMPGEASAHEQMRGCFERCLDRLPRQDRDLAVGYYEGERGVRIANRQRLAAAFQLSDNALRSRVQRLRDQLERCVQTCLSGR
jgi:DNA-directed RNA polymerase specialized sigma24 family protein